MNNGLYGREERVVAEMEDFRAKLEKMLTEAEDCELIARLATDIGKREVFAKLATDLRSMAQDIQATMTLRRPKAP